MKGFNLPDNVSPNDESAPWNKEEQEEVCTCPEDQPSEESGLCLVDMDCPIHGLTEEEKVTV